MWDTNSQLCLGSVAQMLFRYLGHRHKKRKRAKDIATVLNNAVVATTSTNVIRALVENPTKSSEKDADTLRFANPLQEIFENAGLERR